jgi:hypothetical protein
MISLRSSKPALIFVAEITAEENVEREHRIWASTRKYLEFFGENLKRRSEFYGSLL